MLLIISISRSCMRPVYLDVLYSGLFFLKSCSLSVLANLLFSCSAIIILYSLGCRELVTGFPILIRMMSSLLQ